MPVASVLEEKRTWWIVGIAAAVLFAVTNLPWHLDDYDQAKQAFVSFEMVQEGHWFYQHTPNGWVATKPPLVGWISALIFALTRSWDVAWRLPSLLAAATLLVLLSRSAARAFGGAAALLALSACAFNLFAPRLATLVRTDMPLALLIFAIGNQIWEKTRTPAAWTRRDRLVAFALLTAAMLIKGPIVYVFLLPGILIFQLACWKSGQRANAWSGWWPWLLSLVVFLAWVGVGIWHVPEFFENVVIREFGGRFEGTHRAQPLYFYIPHLLHKFAPWTVLLLVFGWLATKSSPRQQSLWRGITPGMLWLLCWSVGGVLAMSLIPSKRVDRIFPVVPPLCLLVAAGFAQLRERSAVQWAAMISVVAAAALSAGYALAKVIPAYRQHRDAYVTFARRIREEANAQRLRYVVIGGEDEGMLLYLRKTNFVQPPDAVADWKNGTIDAVVAPEAQLAWLTANMPGATSSRIGISLPAGNHGTRYALLVRR